MMKIVEISGSGISPVQMSAAIAEDAKQNSGKAAALNKVMETMNYKDVPDDVKREIEQQAGLKPSTQGAVAQNTAPIPSPMQPKKLSLTANPS